MSNYGIYNGEVINLSEAEVNAIIESRDILNEAPKIGEDYVAYLKRLAKEVGRDSEEFKKASAEAKKYYTGEKLRKAKWDATLKKDKAATAAGKVRNDIASGKDVKTIGDDAKKAIEATAKRFNLSGGNIKKILIAVGAAVAAGVSITAIIAAIKHAKKSDSTNESVIVFDENGDPNVVEITNEEYEAIVETRLDLGEDDVCSLVLSNEEVEAIANNR